MCSGEQHGSDVTADEVLALVESRHELSIHLEGRCPGGEVGAYFGRLPNGEQIVFKWSENPAREQPLRAAVEALAALHADGYPMPRYGPVLPFEGGVFVGQSRVNGRWRDEVSDELGEALLECRRLTVGRGVSIDAEPWGRFIIRTLRHGADGWALHQPLRIHSADTRRMLEWVEAVGAQLTEDDFHDRDLVHLDFHHRNALQRDDRRLAAIIDWEAVRQGDSALDLVTLAFGLSVATCSRGLIERVWTEAAQATSAGALTAYVAHMVLRHLDWTVRFHPEETPLWLDVCEDAIDKVLQD
jgi:hypothetical protein